MLPRIAITSHRNPLQSTGSSNQLLELLTTKSVTIVSQLPSLSVVQQAHCCCCTSIAAVATDAAEANVTHHKCSSSSAEHLKTADLFQCKIT